MDNLDNHWISEDITIRPFKDRATAKAFNHLMARRDIMESMSNSVMYMNDTLPVRLETNSLESLYYCKGNE